jgi:outer membrane protein assembly factor BamB
MRTSISIWAGLVLATSGSAAWPASPPPEATAYQITVDHAGVTTSGGAVALQSSPLWTVNLAGPSSYPLIVGGIIYVTVGAPLSGINGTQLLALDAKTGNTIWGPLSIPGNYLWSNAAIDAGKVFVVNFGGELSSFDAATGAPGFSEQLPGQYAFTSPPTAAGGVVYVSGAGDGGTVYAVSEASGAVQWTASVENGDHSSPAVSKTGVYVSYACPQTYALDQGTGAALWHYSGPCEGGGGRTTVYSDGKLYVRDFISSPTGYVFDATSGALISRFASGPIPAVSSSQVFYLNDGALEAHDTATGALLWSFQGDGSLSSAPIVVDQYVLIGSSLGSLYALDARSGAKVWQGNAGNPIPAPDEQNVSQPLTGLAVADGVFVVPAGNTLVAYSLLGPAPPADVTATAGPGQVNLTWAATAGADSYEVFVGTASGAEAAQPKVTGITSTNASITGLTVGTPYFFTLKATSGKLLSFPSNEVTAIPSAAMPPANVTAVAGNGSVNLQWAASNGATGYNVYMGTKAGAESAAPAASGVTGTSTVISGLTNGTSYYFVVKALTGSTISSASHEVSATPQLPAGPTALTATAGDAQVTLSWTAVHGASAYNVYRATTAGGESSTPASSGISGTTTTVSGLSNGTTYYFVVKAVTSSGLTAASNEASAMPRSPMGSSGGGGATSPADILVLLALIALGRLKHQPRTRTW